LSVCYGKANCYSTKLRSDDLHAEYSVLLTPDGAKRLSMALDHVAFKMDPKLVAFGVK